jgi:limonene-1,2-epoxide hydrolase
MTENPAIEIVKSFIASWKTVDIDHIMSFLSEDIFYHNIPMEPVSGLAATRASFKSMDKLESADWELLNIAANGNVVLTERIDRFVISGKSLSIPVMGVFEVENGKIKAWRDYFDLATFTRQMS